MKDIFKNIDNVELQEISNFIKDEPIFFENNYRLLSNEEILNYKKELMIEKNNIIPLIDCGDNDFLIYNISDNIFQKFNIVDEISYKKIDSIRDIINVLKK